MAGGVTWVMPENDSALDDSEISGSQITWIWVVVPQRKLSSVM